MIGNIIFFFFSSRRRHTRLTCDWSSDVCSSDLDGCDMTHVDSPETATPAVQASRAYRIVLIDGQRILRQALRLLFATEREIAVVGEAGHAAEALELIGCLQPDVVVTDLHLTD